MILLLHSSKTMRIQGSSSSNVRKPIFYSEAMELANYLKQLDEKEIGRIMKIKPDLARKTSALIEKWDIDPKHQIVAIDAFLGDIYSGFQAITLDSKDREYADKMLVILSGLYGMIRPLDGIMPYRLEMAYRLTSYKTPSLYAFWGDKLAKQIPDNEIVLNLSSVEYSRLITEYIDPERIITPKFLTINPKTKLPTFVVVHAKIARGAFAHWAIKHRLHSVADIKNFDELGYHFDAAHSSANNPVFVCNEFKGIGLSVRLTSS